MKTIYYVAASLDGFIADENHSVDWLDKIQIKNNASDYNAFFGDIDGLLMGRKTYDFVFDYGKWPYGPKPTWVCTSQEIVQMDGCHLQNERTLAAAIEAAERQNLKSLWVVGGGQLANALIRLQRLTNISVAVMPILLGKGIPLVDAMPKHQFLEQTRATRMDGFTQIEYSVMYLETDKAD